MKQTTNINIENRYFRDLIKVFSFPASERSMRLNEFCVKYQITSEELEKDIRLAKHNNYILGESQP